MPRIAVDLTPLDLGEKNGDAKTLAVRLLAQFQQMAHPYDFLLLTSGRNHKELASLDGPASRRLCVLPTETLPAAPAAPTKAERLALIWERIGYSLPTRVASLLLPLATKVERRLIRMLAPPARPAAAEGLLQSHGVDLLFCPFTMPTYAEPGIPVVSIVYDLQHRIYPQFFDHYELTRREIALEQLRERVDSIACVSEHARKTLLAQFDYIKPERIYVMHPCIHRRLREVAPSPGMLSGSPINARPYMFYPADFAPNKNHRMLLIVYNILLRRNPSFELDLVLSGKMAQQEQELRYAAEKMGLGGRVHFVDYSSDEQLATLLQNCRFVVYPSLYEDFCIRILEAFAFGKPVLCSSITGLPEAAGDAALYFDPRKPMEIAQVIEKILNQPQLAGDLVRCGYQQAAKFSEEKMARSYLAIFDRTLRGKA